MKARDYDYIENRLLSGTDATEAIPRLREVGEADLAERLTQAVQTFTDECRGIRRLLQGKRGS